MRKRVFLKSPVRENRTPGSVRGLLGNWQSYRDGQQHLQYRVWGATLLDALSNPVNREAEQLICDRTAPLAC